MDEMSQEVRSRRRRKSRSSSRKQSEGWIPYLRSADFGRHLFIAMSVLAAAYVGTILYESRRATFSYGPLILGANPSEVRYALGEPQATEQQPLVYNYDHSRRQMTVRFSPDQRAELIRCSAPRANTVKCAPIIGVGIGDYEDKVVRGFGAPTRETYSGDAKAMHYDELGVTFHLRQFEIYALELRQGGGVGGYLSRAFWAMVP